MKSKVSILLLLAVFAQFAPAKTKGQRNPAQDPPRFAPPRPPPLDADFEDPDEEFLENGDAPSRAQNPPPSATPPPMNNDFHPPPAMGGGGGGSPMTPGKLKFQMAEGEYYEKGKKRGRTPPEKRMPQGRFGRGR